MLLPLCWVVTAFSDVLQNRVCSCGIDGDSPRKFVETTPFDLPRQIEVKSIAV
jgi:hypothetical protein